MIPQNEQCSGSRGPIGTLTIEYYNPNTGKFDPDGPAYREIQVCECGAKLEILPHHAERNKRPIHRPGRDYLPSSRPL